jgi:hypothetical protein
MPLLNFISPVNLPQMLGVPPENEHQDFKSLKWSLRDIHELVDQIAAWPLPDDPIFLQQAKKILVSIHDRH